MNRLAPSEGRALLERAGLDAERVEELVVSGDLSTWIGGRDSAASKALHLLATGRVEILRVTGNGDWPIRAKVRGDSGRYSVGWNEGVWRCECEASKFRRRCSHIRAVAMVVLPPT